MTDRRSQEVDAESRLLIERFVAAYNALDVDAMLALVTDDVCFENVIGGTVTVRTVGRAEFEALARQAAAMFRERRQDVRSLARDGDEVLAHIAWRGVPAVDLPGGPSAGAVIALEGTSRYLVRGGRIARLVDES